MKTEIITIEKESFFYLLKECINHVEQKQTIACNCQELDTWVSAEEAKRLLGIKSKTKLQSLRDKGEIVFSQYGRTILYSKKSILEFLERNSVKY